MVPAAVNVMTLALLRDEAERLAAEYPDSAHGLRRLLERSPFLREWVESGALSGLVPAGYSVVRSILFDKLPGANWKVAWHQDLTIAVQEETPAPGFGPWSRKDDVPHVQPPVALLEEMLTVRLHLDPADADNGALRVVPGSHVFGRLNAEQIQAQRTAVPEHLCAAAAGDVLLMRPLILHASAAAASPRHRRVIHLEFARAESLPEPCGGRSW